MTEPEDKKIIQHIKQGEIDQFEKIVKKYTKIIRGHIYNKLFNKADVDDLVQNSFLAFYKSIHRFDQNRPVLPYLYEIAKNEVKMYFRSRKNTVSLNDQIQVADEKIEWGEEEDAMKLLDSLSDDQKKAISLLYEGYSYDDIAAKLKKPLNTIKTIIRRARLRLKGGKDNE